MSDTISTLIAFVGFLIVLSMLAQSVQEAIKSVLKLKTGVWERFFLSLYKREFLLEGKDKKETDKAAPTSFWKRVTAGEYVGDFDSRLKRLKDVVVSADDLLRSVKGILHEIATIPAGSHDASNLLVPKLRELAAKMRELTGLKLDALLSIYDRMDAKIIEGLTGALQAFETAYPDLGYSIGKIDDAAFAALQEKCKELLAAITAAEKKVSDYRQQIECKIDSWITQVNEEYRRNMLKWTAITGFLLVLLFNADAFMIYKYLSTSPKVQAAVAIRAQDAATKVLTSNSDDLNTINDLIAKGKLKDARSMMKQFSERLENDFAMFKDAENEKTAAGMKEKFSKPGENEGPHLLKGQEGDLAVLFALLHKTAVNYHVQGMETLDLPLGWTNEGKTIAEFLSRWREKFKGVFKKDFKKDDVKKEEVKKADSGPGIAAKILSKLGGLLLTAFLITFGAPFWNDILTALVGFKNSMKMKAGTSEAK